MNVREHPQHKMFLDVVALRSHSASESKFSILNWLVTQTSRLKTPHSICAICLRGSVVSISLGTKEKMFYGK